MYHVDNNQFNDKMVGRCIITYVLYQRSFGRKTREKPLIKKKYEMLLDGMQRKKRKEFLPVLYSRWGKYI
jgi:hypothetical protein